MARRHDPPPLHVEIFEDGVSISRAELWAEIESFAGYLSERIEPGDRVVIMMPNRAEFMVTWLAVAACRGILVALNPTARSHDAGHVLRDSAARIAVTDAEHAALFTSLLAYIAWNRGIDLIGAPRASAFLHTIPLFAAVFATTLLGERLMLYHVVGFVLILGGFQQREQRIHGHPQQAKQSSRHTLSRRSGATWIAPTSRWAPTGIVQRRK